MPSHGYQPFSFSRIGQSHAYLGGDGEFGGYLKFGFAVQNSRALKDSRNF